MVDEECRQEGRKWKNNSYKKEVNGECVKEVGVDKEKRGGVTQRG